VETARQRGPLFAVGLLILLAALLRLRPLRSLDLWWHLSMGREVRRAGARVFDDPTSIPTGHAYTDPEWLFDLLALATWEAGGVAAVLLLTAALAATSATLAWLLARHLVGPGRPWAAVLLATLAVGGSSWRFDPRPQSLFLVLLPATILLASRARSSGGAARRGWLAGLVVVLLLWSQSHSSVVIGPAVVLVLCLPRGEPDAPWAPGELAVLIGCCAIPLLGPFGLGVLDQVLSHSGSDAARHITDMRPMPADAWWPVPGGSVMWIELLILIGLVGAVRQRSVAVGPLLLALLGLAMTVTAHRFRAAWALMALPFAAAALARGHAWTERDAAPRLVAAAVLVIPLALWWGEPGPSLRWDRTSVPVDATGAMEELSFSGRLFNDYDGGGWLGWAGDGDIQVFIDGRTPTHFDARRFFAARRAAEDVQVFEALHAGQSFEGVLIRRDQGLCRGLVAHPGWQPAWFGEQRAFFLPEGRAGLRPIHHLAVCTDESSVGRCLAKGDPAPFFAEVDRLRALDPAHGYPDRLGAALALHCARDPVIAAFHIGEAARLGPGHPDLPRFRARLRFGGGLYEEALVALELASPDDGGAADLRLQALRELDRPEEALPLARARQVELGDACPVDLHALVAWACDETGELDCLVSSATRAALLGHAPSLDRLLELRAEGALPATHEGLVDALRLAHEREQPAPE
jgi:hypothetical protein